MKFVLGQKVDLPEGSIVASLPVTDEDVNFELWKLSYQKDHPEATIEQAMHTAWYMGYRARIIEESIKTQQRQVQE